MTRHRKHHGYILIITLAALVLAATMMATFARAAIDHTRAARFAADDLQRRWGAISARQAILPRADQILVLRELATKQPEPIHRAAVRLGRTQLTLIISDEQAKANVNTVLASTDRSNAEDRIHRTLAAAGTPAIVRLRRAVAPTSQPVTGWGQITDASQPSRLLPLAELLTCFGDGRINVTRASDPAIGLAVPDLLQTEIRKFVESRNKRPTVMTETQGVAALVQLLQKAAIDPKQSGGMRVGSTCHSVWIITDDGRRVWYDLAVRDEANPDAPRVRCFSW